MSLPIRISAILLAAAISVFSIEATAFFWYPSTVTNANGIWAVSLATGKSQKIWDGVVAGAVLSPDGRWIAFAEKNKLMVINNDGTAEHSYTTSVPFSPERGQFAWTPGGVFWSRQPCIYRYDFQTGITTKMAEYVCGQYPGKGYWGSGDGRRAWAYMEIVPKDNPDRSGHGDNAFITFSADFSSCTTKEFPGVGYGHCITLDGRYVVIGWTNRAELKLYRFDDGQVDTTINSKLGNGVGLTSVAGINQCVNHNDYLLLRSSANVYYLVNWKNSDPPNKVAAPPGDINGGTVWLGRLPDPQTSALARADFSIQPQPDSRFTEWSSGQPALFTISGRILRNGARPNTLMRTFRGIAINSERPHSFIPQPGTCQ